jgi:uncharacterized OsmC-like protein
MTTTISALSPRAPSRSTLFVVPRERSDGFQASVRGHVLDLIDPDSYALAPNADDLLILSLASTLAWSARKLLRTRRLPDYVSVSAEWRTQDRPPRVEDINLTVAVSREADAVRVELATALETNLASRSLATPILSVSVTE